MKTLCYFLMGVIGTALFFWMMICGWGLEIQSLVPIIIYYIWTLIHITVVCVINKGD